MTTAEYLATPETVLPRELAFGVLRVAESPVVPHQRVVRDLTIALTAFTRAHRLGEVLPAPMDVILDHDADLVVQPDILFVSAERGGYRVRPHQGAPDLVVEVLSPYPRIGRVHEKVEWFARYGVGVLAGGSAAPADRQCSPLPATGSTAAPLCSGARAGRRRRAGRASVFTRRSRSAISS